MKVKIFSVIIGTCLGLITYSFIGYIFTKKLSIGKKYKLKFSIFFILLILVLLIYVKFKK
ncbi:MAG: hypothetical protein NC833_07510 [Candidatus Omnitrophica bacterium]|nr:hypothetical protein [Candidatus Omnitrophota bacterium]